MIGLPGGDEESALALGFARFEAVESGRREGYARANANATQVVTRLVERSNQLLVQDTSNAYILLQPDQNGPFVRSVNLATLRNEFAADLAMGGLPDTLTDDQFRHQLDQKLNIDPRAKRLPRATRGDHNYRPTDTTTGKAANIFIARTAQAKNLIPKMIPMRIRY